MNELGIVSEVQGKKVRVAIGSMVTDFLPVMQTANSFSRHWKPLRVGEECVVLPIRGDLNSGVVLRGIFYADFETPHTKEDEEIVVFEDGASVSYNSSSSTLEILNQKVISVVCQNSVSVECKTANIKTDNISIEATSSATIKSPSISLIGNTNIQGGITTSGAGGGAGSFSMTGSLSISNSISAGGDATFGGSVSDSKGSLTNHTNNGYSRD